MPGMSTHTYIPSSGGKDREIRGTGQPWLHSQLEVSLRYMISRHQATNKNAQ